MSRTIINTKKKKDNKEILTNKISVKENGTTIKNARKSKTIKKRYVEQR